MSIKKYGTTATFSCLKYKNNYFQIQKSISFDICSKSFIDNRYNKYIPLFSTKFFNHHIFIRENKRRAVKLQNFKI